jgi:hypothetical protein
MHVDLSPTNTTPAMAGRLGMLWRVKFGPERQNHISSRCYTRLASNDSPQRAQQGVLLVVAFVVQPSQFW